MIKIPDDLELDKAQYELLEKIEKQDGLDERQYAVAWVASISNLLADLPARRSLNCTCLLWMSCAKDILELQKQIHESKATRKQNPN